MQGLVKAIVVELSLTAYDNPPKEPFVCSVKIFMQQLSLSSVIQDRGKE